MRMVDNLKRNVKENGFKVDQQVLCQGTHHHKRVSPGNR